MARIIAPLVDKRAVLVVLRIGPRFSADLQSRGSAPVQIIVDGRNSNTAMIALNYVRAIMDDFNRAWIASHGLQTPPARLETRAWFNPNLESRWFFIPGIIGMLTLVTTMLVTALTVAREREQGTFDQLLVTPLRPGEILLGKALPGFLIGMVQGTAILLIATLWFKVPLLGSLSALYAGLALFLLSGVGAGLLISSLAVTQQQGLLGAFLFMVPLIRALSGRDDIHHRMERAVLGRDLAANDVRQDYLRARLDLTDELPIATPVGQQDSSLLGNRAAADALVVRPPHAPAASKGEPCTIIRLSLP